MPTVKAPAAEASGGVDSSDENGDYPSWISLVIHDEVSVFIS
jgi:hypothetical protein